jgi:hypothetical protein
MARRRRKLDLRRIRVSQSYSIPEAAKLLERKAPTIRLWIKQGLPVLPDTQPRLICGGELKDWLRDRAKARKQPCGIAKLYCFKCRRPRRPTPDSVATSPLSAKTVKVSGKCNACNTAMQQPRALAKLPEVIAAMTSPRQRQLNLTGYISPSVNPTFWTQTDDIEIDAPREGETHVH